MGNFRSYKEESRKINWGSNDESLNLDQINTGSVLRIADSLETIAEDKENLIEERDKFKRWYKEEREEKEMILRSNAGLRGYITRLKRKLTEKGK